MEGFFFSPLSTLIVHVTSEKKHFEGEESLTRLTHAAICLFGLQRRIRVYI